MTVRFDDLPRWTFRTEEIANGSYEVIGRDLDGHEIRVTGTTDPEAALSDLRERARAMESAI